MRIGISACAADAGKSGIGQYIKQILQRLPEQSPASINYIVFMQEEDVELLDPQHNRMTVVPVPRRWSNPLANILWHLLVFPRLLKQHGCDASLCLAGNRRLGWINNIPSVGVIHDLSQLHIPGKYDVFRTFYVLKILPLLMRRLHAVVAVSHATRLDLEKSVNIDPQRIRVIHNGADLEQFSKINKQRAICRIAQTLTLNTPYILYTARLEHPGKNHVNLLRAFAILKKRHNLPHKLVFAGERWNGVEEIDKEIERLELQQEVQLPGYVESDLLADLTAGADLFVFPSLFEGFGIPLLEAMAAGTVVCASNVSSIPEVTGDAALLFDPEDCQDIARSMFTLLSNHTLATEKRQLGLLRVGQFDWDQSAKQLLESCIGTFTRVSDTTKVSPQVLHDDEPDVQFRNL